MKSVHVEELDVGSGFEITNIHDVYFKNPRAHRITSIISDGRVGSLQLIIQITNRFHNGKHDIKVEVFVGNVNTLFRKQISTFWKLLTRMKNRNDPGKRFYLSDINIGFSRNDDYVIRRYAEMFREILDIQNIEIEIKTLTNEKANEELSKLDHVLFGENIEITEQDIENVA